MMKRNKKRQIAITMALCLGAGLLSGCGLPSTSDKKEAESSTSAGKEVPGPAGDKSGAAEQDVTLRVWDFCDSTVKQREVFHKAFEEKHPGVKVEYTCTTQDMLSQSLVTSLSSGEGPDVFLLPSTMNLKMAVTQNMVVPVSDYLEEDWFNQLEDEVFINGITMLDGKFYAFPEQKSTATSLMYYNKTVLDQAGITKLPETWDEFLSVCKTVTEKTDAYGLIEGGQQSWRMETLIRAFSQVAGARISGFGNVMTADGKPDFDSQAVKDTFAFFNQLVSDGSLHPDTVTISAPVARERFAQNEAAFLVSGMFCIAAWESTNPDLDFGVMALPIPTAERQFYQCADDYSSAGYVIAATSRNSELAAEYLKCMFSDTYDYQKDCVKSGAWLSIVKGINDTNLTNERSKLYYELLNSTTITYPSAKRRDPSVYDFYAQVVDVKPGMGDLLQGVFSKSLPDYEGALKTLSDQSAAEWKRACQSANVDYGKLDFTGWSPVTGFTEEDYGKLK